MASILLIYPKPEQDKNARFGFSLNLLYLASILKHNGNEITAYLDYSLVSYPPIKIEKHIKESEFIIIELDAFALKRSSNVISAELLIKNIKTKFPTKTIIAFGHDLSLSPRDVKGADYSFPTTGIENSILKLINNSADVLDYNKDTEHFDLLPFPDRKLLTEDIEHGGSISHSPNLAKSTLIQTSRGCLNSCTFCQRKGWQNKYINHSHDYVISEFEYLKNQGYKNIWISDDNFTFDLARAKKILGILVDTNISNEMKISCSSWTKIDKEFLLLAKDANISIISFGVESANTDILRFYNKNIDLFKTDELINFADKIGLYTVGNFIIGAPIETENTIKNTFEYALNTTFDQVNIKTLDYMAGAKIFDDLSYDQKKNKRHLFACKENNLNEFYLSELRDKAEEFRKTFAQSRLKKMKEKISKFGTPYEMQKNTYRDRTPHY